MPDRLPPLHDGAGRDIVRSLDRVYAQELDEQGWHDEAAALISSTYLTAETAWEGSGKAGTEADWIAARGGVAYAWDRDGTLLDVGCANGFLMECMPAWSHAHGYAIEPYGLDIVAELAAHARERLPQYAERIWTGNVLEWRPPRRFTYVRVGLEYVLPWRRHELVVRLLARFVEEGGRVILGPTSEPVDQPLTATFLNANGLTFAGVNERPHRDDRFVYRTYWLDG